MEHYSLEFIRQQAHYYRAHLHAGTHSEQRLMAALLDKYVAEQNRRERLPDTLPANWVFPAPPVCTVQWTESDWVRYAAPFNVK